VGRWAERKVRFLFFFSLFLLQTLFKSNLFQLKFKQNFPNFFTNFYRLFILDFTQATKNHAKSNDDAQSLVVSRLIKLN
jgi:hypothetical protein